MRKKSFLAAKIALAACLTAGINSTPPAQAGIPLIDGGALTQRVMTARESILQMLKQIEQRQNRLGRIDGYLRKFQDVAYDPSASPFNRSGGCTNAMRARTENDLPVSESQKQPRDAFSRTLNAKQDAFQPGFLV